MDIKKLITEKRNIKENSLKSYLIILRKLNNNKEVSNLNYLKKTKEIREQIETKAITTQRNYLGAILVVLSAWDKEEYDKALQYYRDFLDELNEKYATYIKSHEKDKKQKENWVSLKDLRKAMNKIKKEIEERDLLNKSELKNNELMLLQKWVITSLYLLQPPIRLDFSMDIINNKKEIKKGTNYLLVEGRNKKSFVFTEFKTEKSYGEKVVKVAPKLNQILNIWLKFNKTDYLLLNNRGGKLSSNGLGKAIGKAFESTGKKITLNLIRHVYISENVNLEEIKKHKKLAEDMLHSTSTQKDYIKV